MARRVRNSIEVFADFSEMVQMLGAGEAMVEDVENNSDYIDAIIDAAYGVVEEEFNVEAAAYAASTGRIKHMYEWGTVGINRARTNMRPNPLTPRARLWRNHLSGKGMTRNLFYTFQTSVAFVPKPTRRDTGMSTETISMLRDHIFHWKSMVFETGATVTIMPNQAKMLLLPFYNGAPPGTPPSHIRRGYNMHPGPVTLTPGERTQGEFTSFWLGWWEGQGQSRMNELVEKQVEQDYLTEIKINKSTGMDPVLPGQSIKARVEAEKKKVQKRTRAKAKARQVGNEEV